MLIGETWHWYRIQLIERYPWKTTKAKCTCSWIAERPRQQEDTARTDWEDHIMETHRKENTP